MTLLAKVEDAFTIPGRGTVIVPIWFSDLKVRSGDSIQLRAPSGQIKDTQIVAIELAYQGSGKGSRAAFILPRDVRKEDVREGTEIWLPEAAGELKTP